MPLTPSGIAHAAYLIGNKGASAAVDQRLNVDVDTVPTRAQKLTPECVSESCGQDDFAMGSSGFARQSGAKVIDGRDEAFDDGDTGWIKATLPIMRGPCSTATRVDQT